MGNRNIINIERAISFMESHLDGKLELDMVARAAHYSKYHLHRMFTETLGMTIHDYARRRQLTEAAKLLVFSKKSIMDIALICGYESQQAFSVAFKAMYKLPPAEYREREIFYPLQMRFTLQKKISSSKFTKENMMFAESSDIPQWMEIVRLCIDGYPYLIEEDYIQKLRIFIEEKRALILKDEALPVGVMAFSYDTGRIEFLGIHPQYHNHSILKIFLNKLMEDLLPGKEISITTYRHGDKADIGYRDALKEIGFAERELLIEFGYPTQRFVLSSLRKNM